MIYAFRFREMIGLRRVEIYSTLRTRSEQVGGRRLEPSKRLEKFAIADKTGKVYSQGRIDFLLRLSRAALGSFKPNQWIELLDDFRDEPRRFVLHTLR